MLSSPVFAKLQHRSNPQVALRRLFAPSFPSFSPFAINGFRTILRNGRPQPLTFQSLADSFHRNGGVPPSLSFPRLPLASVSHRPSHFVSTACNMPLSQLFCFDNHPFSWGVYTPHFYFLRRPRNSI